MGIYALYARKGDKEMSDYMPDRPINDTQRELFGARFESFVEGLPDALESELRQVSEALKALSDALRSELYCADFGTDWRSYDEEFFVNLKNAVDYFGG